MREHDSTDFLLVLWGGVCPSDSPIESSERQRIEAGLCCRGSWSVKIDMFSRGPR